MSVILTYVQVRKWLLKVETPFCMHWKQFIGVSNLQNKAQTSKQKKRKEKKTSVSSFVFLKFHIIYGMR